jgi:hypothetical protein
MPISVMANSVEKTFINECSGLRNENTKTPFSIKFALVGAGIPAWNLLVMGGPLDTN